MCVFFLLVSRLSRLRRFHNQIVDRMYQHFSLNIQAASTIEITYGTWFLDIFHGRKLMEYSNDATLIYGRNVGGSLEGGSERKSTNTPKTSDKSSEK